MRGNHANEKDVSRPLGSSAAGEVSEKQGVSVSGLTPPRALLAVIPHCKLVTATSKYQMEILGYNFGELKSLLLLWQHQQADNLVFLRMRLFMVPEIALVPVIDGD